MKPKLVPNAGRVLKRSLSLRHQQLGSMFAWEVEDWGTCMRY
jgi:hypothetical protein